MNTGETANQQTSKKRHHILPADHKHDQSKPKHDQLKKKKLKKGLKTSSEKVTKPKQRKALFKWTWIWKYGPIAIMGILLSVAWLNVTPEGKQYVRNAASLERVTVALKKNVEDIKKEMDTFLEKQTQLYQELKETTRGKLADSLFPIDEASDIGWALNEPEHKFTKNKTKQYMEYYNSPLLTADLVPGELANDIFVYIPGLFTQWYPGYMRGLISAMKELGLSTYFCDINTAGSVAENAEFVADAIMNLTRNEPNRRVVILGHSKGALDAATAFVLRPEIVPKVSAFIAFQAPWGGSAVANDVLGAHSRLAVSTAFVETVLNGNPHSLVGLKYSERKKWIKIHPFPLGAIPTISVTSHEQSFQSLLKTPIDYVRIRYDELSDGCVATKDAIIPGTILVEIPGLDHFGPAYHGFPACCNKQDPLRVQMALLNVLLHK